MKRVYGLMGFAVMLWGNAFIPAARAEGPALPPPNLKPPAGVEVFEKEGEEHVEDGTRVPYKTNPPTSGSHYGAWLPPSVYGEKEAPAELLVHNLEHGNVVIYYNQTMLSPEHVAALTELTRKHIGQWDGVLLVARPDKKHPVILTAWRHMLRLKSYDKARIDSFVDGFRGRGPEHAVR